MAMRYDPIMCMMVPDTVKTHDELSLSQKKQVVTELKGYLKKSYNFSDESEYARAYEDLRHMFTTGSRKSISGLFENAVKKTGAHDSVEMKDANKYVEKAVQLIKEGKGPIAILSTLKGMGLTPADANSYYAEAKSLTGYRSYDEKTIDKAIRSCDANPEKVAELFKSYYNGRVTAEKLKNVSKSDLGALEWSVKQIPRLIKQGKPSHLINAENMQIERILKSYGII